MCSEGATFGWLWRYTGNFESETSHLLGKFIFKERFSCCSSYRLRKIVSFPSSASIVEGKRGNTCNHKPYINSSQQSKNLFWCLVLKHDFSAKTTESSDIPLSPFLSKLVTVTIKNPVTPPFQQIFLPPRFWVVTWPAATRVSLPTTKGGREERPWERGCEDGCLCVDSHWTIGALMTSKIYRRHRAFDNQCFM